LRLAIYLLEDGVDIECVVALDVGEAVSPGAELSRIRNRVAGRAENTGDAGQGDDLGVDFGRVVVVKIGGHAGAGAGDGRVRGVLIGPGGIAAGGMYDAKNRVGTDEIPGINRRAIFAGVAGQPARVDGSDATIDAGREAAVELRLIQIDAFLIFGGCAVGHAGRARAAGHAVARSDHRRSEETVIGDIVECAGGARRAAADNR